MYVTDNNISFIRITLSLKVINLDHLALLSTFERLHLEGREIFTILIAIAYIFRFHKISKT